MAPLPRQAPPHATSESFLPASPSSLGDGAAQDGCSLHPGAGCVPAQGVCTHVCLRVHACAGSWACCHPARGDRVAAPTPVPASHLVVFGDGLVGAVHGPEILHLVPQGGLHVLQLGLRGGDAFRTLASLRPGFQMRKDKSPNPSRTRLSRILAQSIPSPPAAAVCQRCPPAPRGCAPARRRTLAPWQVLHLVFEPFFFFFF